MSYYNYDSVQKNFFESFAKTIRQKKDIFVVRNRCNNQQIFDMINSFSYEYPEFFYVDFSKIEILSAFIEKKICINYKMNFNQIDVFKKSIDDNVNKIIEGLKIEDSDSNEVKYRKIHNYLIKSITYNRNALNCPRSYPEAYSICGVFLNKTAVCEGISKSYKYLCDKLSIPCSIIVGKALFVETGHNENHAWNVVHLNEKFYHIDVTWDMCNSGSCKYNRYDYYLVPDSWIEKDHCFTKSKECNSYHMTYFYRNKSFISSKEELKKYIQKTITKGNMVFFLKYNANYSQNLENEVYQMIKSEISAMKNVAFSMNMWTNKEQCVFFAKIHI